MSSSVYRGPSSRQEWDAGWRMRDARPWHIRTGEWLSRPKRLSMALMGLIVLLLAVPALTLPVLPMAFFLAGFAKTRRYQLPLRLPIEEKTVPDPSNLHPKTHKPDKAEGIFFLGTLRDHNHEGLEPEELWVSNSDSRTHFLVLGTTGSGKSEMLLSMAFNALSWGSGLIYIDGKADSSLKAKMYSLCKMVGREVDFYLLNFMTGDTDVWERSKSVDRLSNTMNVFVGGSSNSATQLVSSLMPESGGDNAMWQGLAIGMINAVIIGLYFKRWKDNRPIDAGVLRDHIEMTEIIKLAKEFSTRSDAPKDLVFKPIQTYLLNLPGFDWKTNVVQGQPVGEDTKKQHDFRSMQFLRQLTMLADTYGAVFKHQIPEVEMLDVVLNRRILVVMIPSLEKSEEESQGVGKLVVASLKLMMALTLGSKVEGVYADIIDSKPTNAPSPFPVILDELGYYFTKGLAVMFAQARSLGFAMFAAGQDIPAMSKGPNKEEAESVIANTKYKIGLAMEDPDRTGDLLIKTADKAVVAETAGYSGRSGTWTTNYQDMMNVSLQERNRLTLSELRALDSGQGILMWKDKLIRYDTFYAFGSAKLAHGGHLNHLVKVFAPNVSQLAGFTEPLTQAERDIDSRLESLLMTAGAEDLKYVSSDEILSEALSAVSNEFEWPFQNRKFPISGAESGIAMTQRLQHWLEQAQARREEAQQAGSGDETVLELPDDEPTDVGEIFALREEVIPVEDMAVAAVESNGGDWAASAARDAIAERRIVVAPEVSDMLTMVDSIASGDLVLPEANEAPAVSEAEEDLKAAVKYEAPTEILTEALTSDTINGMFEDWNLDKMD